MILLWKRFFPFSPLGIVKPSERYGERNGWGKVIADSGAYLRLPAEGECVPGIREKWVLDLNFYAHGTVHFCWVSLLNWDSWCL